MKTQIGEIVLGIIATTLDNQNEKGFEKYKETLDDVPFMNYDWQQMVIEELIDAIQYMVKENQKLKQELVEVKEDGRKQRELTGFDVYQKLSQRTMPNSLSRNKDKSNYAMGVAGEAGELVDMIKKEVHHGHEINEGDIMGEIGDVLHYLSGIATLYNLRLLDCAKMNLSKLQTRYPNGFNKEDSIKRMDIKKEINSEYGKQSIDVRA